ncbi:GNAT family N-acetyltransferase [Entomohabitans teleogrylli]|uniref:GNAT family N-acetyltransferase n=1 Tax=Entomohabitans teleogrylli TaxID=1384589 RepID=UPI00073D500C|nr:N-acetyltransferase [Entomohabitans teleogrylli]
MVLSTRPATDFSIVQLADILAFCFRGYPVALSMTPERFARRFMAEDLSLPDSVVWMAGEQPAAIALVARRDWSARLAAFAVSDTRRGQGLGKRCMAQVVAQLARDGVRDMRLEVLADNVSGMALYQSLGFEIQQRLLGFSATDLPDVGDLSAEERWQAFDPAAFPPLAPGEAQALPWQMAPATLNGLPGALWRYQNNAWAAISRLTATPQLRLLYVAPELRRQGKALALLQALGRRWPGISTSVCVPERFTPLFTAAGYAPMALSQYEMRLSFPPVPDVE